MTDLVAEPVKVKRKLPVINPTNAEQKYTWNFSASQVDIWNLCKRKFGFKYIDKIKGTNKYATRGSETHLHLENWLIHGIEPPLDDRYGALARTAIVKGYLPLPGEAFVERGFKFITPRGISYLAYLDIEFFDKLINSPVVGDHKTTTDFKWAHTPESLVQNVQAVVYSNISFENWQRDQILLRWVYYKDAKTRPASKKIEAFVKREDMFAKMFKIDLIAEEIAIQGLTVKQAKDLPKNPLACEQYGGCPYEPICGVTDMERLGAIMEQSSIRDRLMKNMVKVEEVKQAESVQQPAALSALDRMRQKAAAAAKQSVTTTAVATTKPVAASVVIAAATTNVVAPKPVGGNSVLARLAAKKAATPAVVQEQTNFSGAPESVVEAAVNDLTKALEVAIPVLRQHNAFDINPPEQPVGDEIIDDPDVLAAQVAESKAGNKAKKPETAAEEAKKARGRPAGSTTVKPLSDEGYIFARVFAEVCRETRGEITMATSCATAAVKAFRDLD